MENHFCGYFYCRRVRPISGVVQNDNPRNGVSQTFINDTNLSNNFIYRPSNPIFNGRNLEKNIQNLFTCQLFLNERRFASSYSIRFLGTSTTMFEEHGVLGVSPTREGHVGSSVNSNQPKGFDGTVTTAAQNT